jgi:hypothetical protein
MPRFERVADELRLDLNELISNCVEATLPVLRQAVDDGDMQSGVHLARDLVMGAEAIGQRAEA